MPPGGTGLRSDPLHLIRVMPAKGINDSSKPLASRSDGVEWAGSAVFVVWGMIRMESASVIAR